MKRRQNFIRGQGVGSYDNIKMELNQPSNNEQSISNVEPYTVDPSKPQVLLDTSINFCDPNKAKETISRSIHIPYILNGELFEIQTQEGENVTVKCCNCPPDRVYRGSVRSTGNFHMHIKRRHPDLMGKIYDMKVNALVERRDRFIRNRKSTRRRNNTNLNRRQTSHNGQRMPYLTQPHSELFKIKAAFQRHQQQQQKRSQQLELKQTQLKTEHNSGVLHKWNIIDHFMTTPAFERARNIALMDTYNDQPLNYSLRQCANEDTVGKVNHSESTQEIVRRETNTSTSSHKSEMPMAVSIDNEQITEYGFLLSHDLNNTPIMTENDKHVVLQPSNSDQSLYCRATTISAITPCPSDVSSYDASPNANHDEYGLNSNLGLIKNEIFLNEVQPIDLSVHPSSSDLSGCSGYGSAVNATQSTLKDTINLKVSENVVKFDELLLQAIAVLQSLQREIQTYNQTNNNWLGLEIAKFKFLHPNFQFQCQC